MSTPTLRDSDSVYRVIEMVATSETSWEDAAANAVSEATKSINDLRVARVNRMDTVRDDEGTTVYRVRLSVSYRFDRRRRSAETGETQVVRRYLVVANQTVGGPALTGAIRERMSAGPAEFHVVVPATMSRDYAAARRLATFSVDPTSGYTFGDLGALPTTDEEGLRGAQSRLDEQIRLLQITGAAPTGEVGDPDPMNAVTNVLDRASFDEILVSTLPSSVSRWVKMDLPSRLQRRFGLPVVHVEEEG
ncbi:MAG: dodecin family protein [Acidimicrobiia bacterium]|nr:dodecin family protein [Acidimicrobiia bacterium]